MEKYINENDGSFSFIKYVPDFLNEEYIEIILDELKNDNYFSGETNYGSQIPRVQKWMHNNDKPFSLLWEKQYERWQPKSYNQNLKNLQNNLVNLYLSNHQFPDNIKIPELNSALVNKYRSGKDSIAFHRDNLPEFGENPTIMVVSFGETREIKFRRVIYDNNNPKSMKMDRNNKDMNFNINLENGSLLIMGGSTQKYYAHGIDKTSDHKDERYSITFREHIPILKNNV